ncbi:hypothetical protein ACLMJK_003231 [Lecanora helva]
MGQQSHLDSILIIGAGVFGLSTTLALLSNSQYNRTKIILVDPFLPTLYNDYLGVHNSRPTQNLHAASIDSSRIIRPDYAKPAYARLASLAQQKWRDGFGTNLDELEDVVYRESGIVLTADKEGSSYVDEARENTERLGCHVESLKGRADVEKKVLGTVGRSGSGIGENGYANWGSGWANNGKAMERFMTTVVERARERGGVRFERGKVTRLLYDCGDNSTEQQREKKVVLGAEMENRQAIQADLTIVAAGAWSGALVDLRGRAEARGQVMAYVPLTDTESQELKNMPVLINLSTGMFIIPPVRDAITGEYVLKVARHSYGYANPTTVTPEGVQITSSLPHAKFAPIPKEGEYACRQFLQHVLPKLGKRAFSSTRLCWYTDTPSGDFIVSYHPYYAGLFLATGGSGHGFKFLPVLGEKIVASIEGRLEEELAQLWQWSDEGGEERRRETQTEGEGEGPERTHFDGTEDGSRSGIKGAVLEEEWRRDEDSGKGVERSKL